MYNGDDQMITLLLGFDNKDDCIGIGLPMPNQALSCCERLCQPCLQHVRRCKNSSCINTDITTLNNATTMIILLIKMR